MPPRSEFLLNCLRLTWLMAGEPPFFVLIWTHVIQPFLIHLSMVLMLESLPLHIPSLPLTRPPFMTIKMPLIQFSQLSSQLVGILALSLEQRWSHSLALFKRHHFLLFPKLMGSFVLYRIYLSPIYLVPLVPHLSLLQLITQLILTTFRAPGVHSRPQLNSFYTSLLAPRALVAMLLMHSAQSRFIQASGRALWSASQKQMSLLSTRQTDLTLLPLVVFGAHWLMPSVTSFELKALAHSSNGSTIFFFYVSQSLHWLATTTTAPCVQDEQPRKAASTFARAGGTLVTSSQTELVRSLTNLWFILSRTFPNPLSALPWMPPSRMAQQTLTVSLCTLGSLGRWQRQHHLHRQLSTWASPGTSSRRRLPLPWRNKRSIVRQWRNGLRDAPTPFGRFRSSMESSCMQRMSYPVAEHTSWDWKPCLQPTVTILTALTDPQSSPQVISSGGPSVSPLTLYPVPYRPRNRFQSSSHSLMPAQELDSASSLPMHGQPTHSGRVGRRMVERLLGQRLLASSSSSTPWPGSTQDSSEYKSTATIPWSSVGGDLDEVATRQSIQSSSGYTAGSKTKAGQSSSSMSLQPPTLQTNPPEASTLASPDSQIYHFRRRFHSSFTLSPSTHSPPCHTRTHSQKPYTRPARTPWRTQTQTSQSGTSDPRPSRPSVVAAERLLAWTPGPTTSSISSPLPSTLQCRIQEVLGAAYKKTTLRAYGTGLARFMEFCDDLKIPEADCSPCTRDVLAGFISSLAGSFSGSAISGYVAGVRAWHILHRVPWVVDSAELSTLLRGADSLTPATSKRPLRQPYTPSIITCIREGLDLSTPLDAAIFACLTTSFYSCARLGEFTLTSRSSFNPRLHITPAHVSTKTDREGHSVHAFRLPSTKSAPGGEEVFWAVQSTLR